jgi:hypothetical protein
MRIDVRRLASVYTFGASDRMFESSIRSLARVAAALAMGGMASIANAQVYKCTDAAGRTTYSDAPCSANIKPYKLPEEPTKGAATNPQVCAQLLDETRRLDAEAERTIKRGATESADNAKRRQAMTKQYAARCVGVSRSAPN